MKNDISTAFKWQEGDAAFAREILKYEGTPEAIKYFEKRSEQLSDYAYWFFLSTLWVSYSGQSDINIWRELLSSNRPNKSVSIMKPSELKALGELPSKVTAFRAHRANERDWISYTLDANVAGFFSSERGTSEIKEYRIRKRDITALLLRRGEKEIIVLDKDAAKYVRTIEIGR